MEYFHPAQSARLPIRIAAAYLNKISTDFWQDHGQLQNYLNFLLCEIDPLFNQKRLAAEVVRIDRETEETTTLVLRPTTRWRGFEAGQFINIELEVGGVRYHRNYSLSCSPEYYKKAGLIAITAKQVSSGKVSPYLNQAMNISDIVHISQAMGQFIWHASSPELSTGSLFVAGGSGITPIKSMIDQIVLDKLSGAVSQTKEEITLIHYAKNVSDIIFKEHFEKLSDDNAIFTYICHFSDHEGAIDQEQLARDCSDLKSRDWYLCGPEGFMNATLKIASSLSVNKDQIHKESFSGARAPDANTKLGSPCKITFNEINRQVQSDGHQSLLELAELAGLKPKYGCRSGICHECKCQRPQGHLFSRMTGEFVPEDQHTIQACITVPAGDLTLNQW